MTTRRDILIGAGATAGSLLLPGTSLATPAMRDAEIAAITNGAPVRDGRVRLTIPELAENGLSVYTVIDVESPMTPDDYVKAVHILSEENPIARLLTAHFTPQMGIAKLSTNLRLADTQEVTALAEMSDGTFWRDVKKVVVTIAACIDGLADSDQDGEE